VKYSLIVEVDTQYGPGQTLEKLSSRLRVEEPVSIDVGRIRLVPTEYDDVNIQ
jgi:hypothetical protein